MPPEMMRSVMSTALLPLALVVGLAGSLTLPTSPQVPVITIDPSSGTYAIHVNELDVLVPWLLGAKPTLTVGDDDVALTYNGSAISVEQDAKIGGYNYTQIMWTGTLKNNKTIGVHTNFKVCLDNAAIIFEQYFPDGIDQSNNSNHQPILAFPSFTTGGREGNLSATTWRGTFSILATGDGAVPLRNLPNAARGGGPVVIVDEYVTGQSMVLSAMDNFLASSSAVAGIPPPPAPPLNCSSVASCHALPSTDLVGNPKVDIRHTANISAAECCQLCTQNPQCEAWARPPGAFSDCYEVAGVTGITTNPNRECGCPNRSSTLALWKETAKGGDDLTWWTHGISGDITSIPPQFRHSTVLTSGSSGLTDGLTKWGSLMKVANGYHKNPDMALSHLSYWTDNGAYYYMYNPSGVCDSLAHGPIDKLIQQLIASWDAQKIPVRTIQLDDWWYIGSEPESHDHMCVKEFGPDPKLFPSGLPKLPPQISYNLYGPFFCQDNIYKEKFLFTNASDQVAGNIEADPISPDFYDFFFSTAQTSFSTVTNYEVDFLYDQTQWFTPFVTTLNGTANWLNSMAQAADKLSIGVQYCMAHPAAFMNAMSLPAVTNGRASGDYQSPTGNLLVYGTSAPFFSAVGIAPSKDNWHSMESQPKPRRLPSGPPPCAGGSANVTNSYLHALVATLSTGPVGFSDAIGFNNLSLILSTCRGDGLLLKPSRPLAAIDRSFSSVPTGTKTVLGPPVPKGGHVWSTHTIVNGSANVYLVLAMSIETNWMLVRADLYPLPPSDAELIVWNHPDVTSARKIDANTEEIAQLQTSSSSSEDESGDIDHLYISITTVDSILGGWAYLGESQKLTPVSEQRALNMVSRGCYLQVTLAGSPGEVVSAAAWHAGSVVSNTSAVDSSGRGILFFFSSSACDL